MKEILYINATVGNNSRTDILARYLLSKIDGHMTEIKLESKEITPLDSNSLSERESILNSLNYDNEKLTYAKQFANSDIIVIAAPFWDLSFPAKLKVYIENICVNNVTFKYSDEGFPVGLCKAEKLYFVSTAGGKFIPDFGYNYIKSLSNNLFGIKDTDLIYAEGLDINGNDINKILNETKKKINEKY